NGVVVKVEPSLQAAFVDYGGNRHGFLPMGEIHDSWYAGDSTNGDRGRPRIQDVLKRNQKVLVQVAKEELGNKGASLTTYISLPGRYLVLMPGSDSGGGISRKIEDEEERKKLKETIAQLNPPPDIGIIVRTAGLNRNKTELQRDLTYLQRLWSSIQEKSKQSPAPALIYQEHDLVIRSIRDYFTPDIQEVLVDNRDVYRRARDFFQAVMPRYQGRVKLYREKAPIFAQHGLENQIEAIYTHKVELKSGGSIVIDQTEALVAIDVNSGRATREKGIEETAYKTNMEAAQEVARQLRLRDMGGLIVIDFIDMRNIKHIQEIEKALRQAVKRDKARTQVARISQFGLLELSRQRLKPTILEGNYLHCPHCEGTGLVKSTVSLALAVLRRIRAEVTTETVAAVKAILPMDVATYLQNNKRKEISSLEEDHHLTVQLLGDPVGRQGEYDLEFVRRAAPVVVDPASVEKSRRREPAPTATRSTSSTSSPRSSRGERDEVKERKPRPAVAVAEPPAEAIAVNGDAVPVLAVARGRVFWRLTAAARREEGGRATTTRSGSTSGGRRHPGGRVMRRTRTWWRRRSSSSQNTESAVKAEASKSNGQSGA
ncbi:MAG: Rne/Rng family ribonuclease, partial [Candidatus Tectomicrobia bacterium]|nr:Rne/Rng family ribonuclease [Candidatus Tectomicrobia bacterium]